MNFQCEFLKGRENILFQYALFIDIEYELYNFGEGNCLGRIIVFNKWFLV